MTDEEELERYYEDRDMAENDLEFEYDTMKRIETETDLYESNPEWLEAWDQANSLQNEISSLNSAISDLEEKLGITY